MVHRGYIGFGLSVLGAFLGGLHKKDHRILGTGCRFRVEGSGSSKFQRAAIMVVADFLHMI